MINEKMLKLILDSREDRQNKQIELLNKFPYSLVSFTLNTPGEIKDSKLYRNIHKEGVNEIIDVLKRGNHKTMFFEETYRITGPEAYIAVDVEAKQLKELMVSIEDKHRLGRIFDIDIFDKEHNQISRSEMGLPMRKCLVCDNIARVCMKNRTHSYEELIKKLEEMARYLGD